MPRAGVLTSVTHDQDVEAAAQQLYAELTICPLSLVLFFCASHYDLEALSSALQRRFGEIPLVGCTTAGEIGTDGYISGSISAIGFCEQDFAIEAALVNNLADFSFSDAQSLVHGILDGCQSRQVAPIKGHSFALALLDGLSVREEQLLNVLNAHLGSIPLLGGSAGDDLYFRDTHVYFEGHFHSDAAILMVVNSRCSFEVFSIDHLSDTRDKLVVTEADSSERRVYEFNAVPAAQEYARTIGLEIDQLTPEVFAMNPLSVRIGDRFYSRAIQKVNDDLSLTFYCAVETGIVLTRARCGDMVQGLEQLFDDIERKIGPPQLVIGYDCIFRRLESQQLGLDESIRRIFQRYRVLGFNTYGEQLDGMHLNQTFTGVALGGCDGEQR
ncbi:GfdT protein [Motiliproteus coralliicola]|uniref:GfdT protein n=2 Tax=Motiliproteus coralliicola TaxID=2283196 RepID=A0A369X0C9_9GAMM|nr:GfdT protein [Motiliproteus coralliicola]